MEEPSSEMEESLSRSLALDDDAGGAASSPEEIDAVGDFGAASSAGGALVDLDAALILIAVMVMMKQEEAETEIGCCWRCYWKMAMMLTESENKRLKAQVKKMIFLLLDFLFLQAHVLIRLLNACLNR